MALVFYTNLESPVQCAVEINRADKADRSIQLRMGIHSGPVSGIINVNGHANLAGAGINMNPTGLSSPWRNSCPYLIKA
jgi:hypothetical protein